MTMRIFLVALVLVLLVNLGNIRRSLSKEEDLELERQLKILVKPSVKTIHTKSDVFDCVDIYKQPAFDNPLLKNHKIQLTPNFAIEETTDDKSYGPTNNIKLARTTFEIQGESCPRGFTPIRRTTKDDLIRAKYLHKPNYFWKKNLNKPNSNYPYKGVPFESVSYLSDTERDPERQPEVHYYGGKATLTVHNPTVTANQFSTAHMTITSTRTNGDDNSIHAGWTVYPALFGDNKTRLFAYWTADGYNQSGCYNTLCTGFVQTSSAIGLGSDFNPVSEYGGEVYGLIVIIKQAQNGDWWLMVNDENNTVGYWPKSLFNLLSDDASFVAYGGEAGGPSNEPLPPMGNGQFPESGDLTKEGYILNMKVINTSGGSFVDFDTKFSGASKSADSTCYGFKYYGYNGPNQESTFGYGGPGGQCLHHS